MDEHLSMYIWIDAKISFIISLSPSPSPQKIKTRKKTWFEEIRLWGNEVERKSNFETCVAL